MKTSAEKSSTKASTPPLHKVSRPFFAKAGGGEFFASPSIQMKMTVNKPGDAFEQEADRMADNVMRMPATKNGLSGERLQRAPEEKIQKAEAPNERLQRKDEEKIQRAEKAEEKLQRKGDGTPAVQSGTQSAIQNKMSGGRQLSSDVRGYMEPRFGADFGDIRIHNDKESAGLSNQLGARAFTYHNHIFFSREQYQPGTGEGKHLLAHELTHTVQQGHAVQRSPQVSVSTAQPHIQRSVAGDILNWIADKANSLPGFRMFTIILGVNPINMSAVDRSSANLLRALIEFMPGGALNAQALDNHGVFNKVATWAESQIKTLGMVGSMFKKALSDFIDSLGGSDLLPWKWGDDWDRAKSIFTTPINRLISFAAGLVSDIIKFIKDAILIPLAALAQGTRGYDLLKAVLGEDPITGEPVPRTADNLIGGFMKFIGQEEIWENIKNGHAIERAWAWFQGALAGLMGLVRSIPQRIINTIASFTILDIITVAGAFGKIVGLFAGIAGDFLTWGLRTSWNLLEIIFDVVKPGIMGYIKRTGAALQSIIKNPLPFVRNLVNAAKLAFQNFADNFGQHLKAGLIDWLTGSLTGVYIPKALSLPELGKFALSVLGISWAQIRAKIVKTLGANGESIMKGLETGFNIVVALVTGGPAAAWELIKEKLTDLKDQVVSGIVSFVTETVIKKAVPKLIAMFIPGAGFISAIISIYDTIMVFVQKISKIIQVVVAFIDSLVTIAAGNIAAAAKRVESILGGLLTLAINFLAGFLGLGKITDKIMGVIERVRATIDKALDAVVAWIVDKAKMLFGKAKGAVTNWWKARKAFKTQSGEDHTVFFTGEEKNVVPMVSSKDPVPIENKLDEFTALANAPNATADQKKSLVTINQTRKVLKQDPDDNSIVSNVRDLFDVFYGDSPTKQTVYLRQGQTLKGDPTVVGAFMRIDWLSYDYIQKNPGSPPGSGQDELMNKLVTDPKKRSAFKYVRGHLLNENLGGKGENENLFPITANANSQHLHSTEKFIKDWVAPDAADTKGEKTKKMEHYAMYEVEAKAENYSLSNTNVAQNFVNAKFNCRVILKDDSGAEKKSFQTSIDSEYSQKNQASTIDLPAAKPPPTAA